MQPRSSFGARSANLRKLRRLFCDARSNCSVFAGTRADCSPEHKSNPLGAEYEMILREGKKFVLNIGASATTTRYPNCIEFERKIFRHTDVVGDAHCLPFRNGIFDCVFAFNVFEHLENPRRAAAEILRVLKRGGSLVVHTAFLEPLHEAPFHFYNATEHGVRSWFKYFGVEKCHVSRNFTVSFMLAFLLSQVPESVGASCGKEARETVGQSTLRDWADFWSDRSKVPAVFQELQNLPNEFQSGISAGFDLVARKPSAQAASANPRRASTKMDSSMSLLGKSCSRISSR
jgi:SAM-dependent methyltransferase